LAADADGARLGLQRLTVFGPDAEAGIQGDVAIGPGQPMAVNAAFTIDAKQAERQAVVRIAAEGTLEDLGITVDGTGVGLEIKATAQAHPFSAQLPLSALDATVRGLDLAAWVEGLPEAMIHASVSLALEGELLPAAEVAPPQSPAPDGAPPPAGAMVPASSETTDPLARLAALRSRLNLV